MTNNEIVNLARLVLDDIKTPYFWKDDELYAYLSKGIQEFASVSKVIIDDETIDDGTGNPICQITVDKDAVGYTGSYTLHPCIVEVLQVWFNDGTNEWELVKASTREASQFPSNWKTITTNRPTNYLLDKTTKKITIYYVPSVDGILTLKVIRTPFIEPNVTEPDIICELPAEHHLGLVDYILYRAYLKNDSETYNPNKAKDHLSLFTGAAEKAKKDSTLYNETTEYVRPLKGNL